MFNGGPTLRLLYEAQLVIADLSASVEDALLELGIRMGLRRGQTLLVADEQCRIPAELAALWISR